MRGACTATGGRQSSHPRTDGKRPPQGPRGRGRHPPLLCTSVRQSRTTDTALLSCLTLVHVDAVTTLFKMRSCRPIPPTCTRESGGKHQSGPNVPPPTPSASPLQRSQRHTGPPSPARRKAAGRLGKGFASVCTRDGVGGGGVGAAVSGTTTSPPISFILAPGRTRVAFGRVWAGGALGELHDLAKDHALWPVQHRRALPLGQLQGKVGVWVGERELAGGSEVGL